MLQNPPISIDEVCLGVSMQTMYHWYGVQWSIGISAGSSDMGTAEDCWMTNTHCASTTPRCYCLLWITTQHIFHLRIEVVSVCVHRLLRSAVNASATTKLLSLIDLSKPKIRSRCCSELTLAPATRKGKKKRTPVSFVFPSACSVVLRMLSTCESTICCVRCGPLKSWRQYRWSKIPDKYIEVAW